MGYQVTHKRIKERYSRFPNAAERRHHERVCAMDCFACDGQGGVAHHMLQSSPYKRWRRDHRQVINLCDPCHRSLHAHGNEVAWADDRELDFVRHAQFLWLESMEMGLV